eukprot:4819250-Prymnesium_polylepis.1
MTTICRAALLFIVLSNCDSCTHERSSEAGSSSFYRTPPAASNTCRGAVTVRALCPWHRARAAGHAAASPVARLRPATAFEAQVLTAAAARRSSSRRHRHRRARGGIAGRAPKRCGRQARAIKWQRLCAVSAAPPAPGVVDERRHRRSARAAGQVGGRRRPQRHAGGIAAARRPLPGGGGAMGARWALRQPPANRSPHRSRIW